MARYALTAMLFSKDPDLLTFALLDPSLAFGLQEDLEDSTCFHCAVFRDPGTDEAAAASPSLVSLTAARLWSHLRKFHRVVAPDQSFFLLR